MNIELSKIHANPKNPRKIITNEDIDNMAASLNSVGLKNPIKLNVLPDGTYELISGHIRFAGAQKLGWETIRAEILTLSPEDALLEAILDNQGKPMNWLEKAEAMQSMLDSASKPSQQVVADKLGTYQRDVSRKTAILRPLTPSARVVIYTKSLKVYDGDIIPQTVVERLTNLDDPGHIEKALNIAIDKKMTEPQAKKLVDWVKAGHPVEDYAPQPTQKAAKVPKSERPAPTEGVNTVQPTSVDSSASQPKATHPTQTPKASSPAPTAMGTTVPGSSLGTGTNKASASPGQLGTVETLAWDVALGISVLTRIKAKVKKGERPTFGEALLLAGDKLIHLLIHLVRWVSKNGIRGIFRITKWVWHTFMESLKITGLYPLFRAICFLAFFLFAIWFGWEAYHYGFFHPVKVIAAKVLPTPLARYVLEQPTPVPTEVPVVVATPVPTVQAAIISTPTTTDVPKAVAEEKPKTVSSALKNFAATPAQTPAVKKTDVAGDILKAAPAGVDVAKKLFGL